MAKFYRCPRCGSSLLGAKSLSGGESVSYKECSNTFCGTLVDTYEPTIMQHNFLKDGRKFKGVFGG